MFARSLTGKAAPEFSALKGWLNTPSLTMDGLKGKVVLLDFWTYSCVNCIRSLPHMKQIYRRYSGDGFVLVGVHTPEFEFEKIQENVAQAVERFGIDYPVALDSDNVTWKLYGNQYWPKQTLIDANGRIRWEHAGEGDYEKMETQIRNLLRESGKTVPEMEKDPVEVEAKGHSFLGFMTMTPEIYTGALRSQGFGNSQVCVPGSCIRFIDPGDHERDVVYLQGDWIQFPEFIMHATQEPGYVLLRYSARNANAVLGALNKRPVRVGVELDGKPLGKEQAGADVRWSDEGSFTTIDGYRLYDILRTKEHETHELKLATDADDLCLYAYTFG